MITKLKVSKLTIVFKIALSKLIDKYPKIKNSSLSLHCFKKHLNLTKEVCTESASEFNKFLKFTSVFSSFVLFCLRF